MTAIFHPTGDSNGTPQSLVILHQGQSPTADIYFRPRFEGSSFPVSYIDISQPFEGPNPFSEGTFVVIVRYLNGEWAKRLAGVRAHLSGVAYLMDDDIPGVLSDKKLPRYYAWKVAFNWWRWKKTFARLTSEVWLTSPGLLARYGDTPGTRCIEPMYVPGDPGVAETAGDDGPVRIFYHGERTHVADTVWLAEVARRVQATNSNTIFEVIGRIDVKRAYRGIERVRVTHPMTWQAYLSSSRIERAHIGLAPLGDGAYNRSRSINKLFDITRMGAAGIFADQPPYAGTLADGQEALLCGPGIDAWVDAITALANDPDRRAQLHAEAKRFCLAHNERERANPVTQRFMA